MDRAILPLEPTSPSHQVVLAHLISSTITPNIPHKKTDLQLDTTNYVQVVVTDNTELG
jgi:hypothetical protein